MVFVISQLLKQGLNIPKHSHFIIKVLKFILKVIIIIIIIIIIMSFIRYGRLQAIFQR
jgi:hypothetical protein